jgi:hypothetical protein
MDAALAKRMNRREGRQARAMAKTRIADTVDPIGLVLSSL